MPLNEAQVQSVLKSLVDPNTGKDFVSTRSLRNVKVGEIIDVRTRGARYRYRISSVAVVPSTDARLLGPTARPAITLVTCYPFYFVGNAPQRFVVRGLLVHSEET